MIQEGGGNENDSRTDPDSSVGEDVWIRLVGIPLTALAAGIDAADMVATCQAIMRQLAGSMGCGS